MHRRQKVVWSRIGWSLAAASLVLVFSPVAHADWVKTRWTTYLRAAPGDQSKVLDELPHDEIVDVLNCAGKWCAIRQDIGVLFVDRAAIDTAGIGPWAARPRSDTACVEAPIARFRAPKPVVFCVLGQ